MFLSYSKTDNEPSGAAQRPAMGQAPAPFSTGQCPHRHRVRGRVLGEGEHGKHHGAKTTLETVWEQKNKLKPQKTLVYISAAESDERKAEALPISVLNHPQRREEGRGRR